MGNSITISLPETNLMLNQATYFPICIEAFLVDRKSSRCSPRTIKYYASYLNPFVLYCETQSVTYVQQISPSFIRSYMLLLQEKYNPGGLHAAYRALRAFFRWVEFEDLMPDGWKNPISRVKAPKVPQEIIDPISLIDVACLLDTCKSQSFMDLRDRAILLFLLDTGIRAQELCNLNREDIK